MLTDLIKTSVIVFNEINNKDKNLSNPASIVEVYKNLSSVIQSVNLVANHYLALKLDEEFLQNSSFGNPLNKWRYFFNKDLELLNDSIKAYLLVLSDIGFKGDYESILSKYFNAKGYYGFVRDEYNIGFVEPCGSMLYITQLNTQDKDIDNIYLAQNLKIDLSTYELKVQLQIDLNEKLEVFKNDFKNLKEFILSQYILEDILQNY